MTLTFEFDHATPLYRQLYNYIKSEIKDGKMKSGEKLPSKRNLALHLKISQNTVETAYQQLAAEGYIKSKPKSGFFVYKLKELSVPAESLPKSLKHNSDTSSKTDCRYDFKTNTVDTAFFPFATWVKISKEIMHEKNKELLKTTHPQGDYLLRESIAKYLHNFRGVSCIPEQMIIGAGTEYLLGLIVQILGRDLSYAVENPGYPKTYKILKSNGVKAGLIGLDEEGIKTDELSQSNSNIVYVTPSHHFPLGIIMPVARRMQLLKWASQSDDRFIIEDDYDSEFRFNGRPIPALQGLDTNEKVIYLGTFSKSIAPSIRISYMVLPIPLLKKFQSEFAFFASTVSRFEQYTLYKFIEDGHFERHLNKMRNVYKARKDRLVEEIKKLRIGSRIEIIGENAGLHLLLKINGFMKEKELIAHAENFGVKLYGLSDYYIEPEKDMPDNVVVLGYSNFSGEEISDAIALLNSAWV